MLKKMLCTLAVNFEMNEHKIMKQYIRYTEVNYCFKQRLIKQQ